VRAIYRGGNNRVKTTHAHMTYNHIARDLAL